MLKSLESLGDNLRRGIDDFSRNPVKYSLGAAKDVARDYSDLGVSVFGGLCISKDGSPDLLGDLNFAGGLILILLGGGVGTYIDNYQRNPEACDARVGRNITGGLGVAYLLRGTPVHLAVGAGFTAISAIMHRNLHRIEIRDEARRQRNKTSTNRYNL